MYRVWIVTGALMLSGCASLGLNLSDLPTCSGHDRRPLNADLWDWQGEGSERTGIVRAPNMSTSSAPVSRAPDADGAMVGSSTTPIAYAAAQTVNKQSWWNILASEKPCEVHNG